MLICTALTLAEKYYSDADYLGSRLFGKFNEVANISLRREIDITSFNNKDDTICLKSIRLFALNTEDTVWLESSWGVF